MQFAAAQREAPLAGGVSAAAAFAAAREAAQRARDRAEETLNSNLLQVTLFLHSFSDVLGIAPPGISDTGPTSLAGFTFTDLRASLLHGDLPGVHRVHNLLLGFLARASEEVVNRETDTDAICEAAGQFTAISSELASARLFAVDTAPDA